MWYYIKKWLSFPIFLVILYGVPVWMWCEEVVEWLESHPLLMCGLCTVGGIGLGATLLYVFNL